MEQKTPIRTNLIIRIAFTLVAIFLFVSVINLQVEMNDLREARDARVEKVAQLQDAVDELELRIDMPIDDEYIERIARDELGYRRPNEIIFVNDIAE